MHTKQYQSMFTVRKSDYFYYFDCISSACLFAKTICVSFACVIIDDEIDLPC